MYSSNHTPKKTSAIRVSFFVSLLAALCLSACDDDDPVLDPACGDGVLSAGEQCDDGNTLNGDGCDSRCGFEAVPDACGDGALDAGEECDDGNLEDGDGCDADCRVEADPGYCGDGALDAGEECDDGNLDDGDGCDADCRAEAEPARCGDGVVDAGEQCDDGNLANGDGCNADCQVERMGPRPGIQAITQIGDANVYFFSAGEYARYGVADARIGDNYPLPVLGEFSNNWPRGWDDVDAAVNLGNGNLYFFKGREYIRYNIGDARVADGYPLPIAGQFSGNWPNWDRVDGAVNLGNGSVYFFKGREYIRYGIEEARIADNYPLPIAGNFSGNWPNWDAIDGAVNYGNGSAYFFRGDQYMRYDIADAVIPPNYPSPIEHQFSGNWTPPSEW